MDRYLRKWRQEALNKGQHEAAIYIGDKVLALTDDDTDAYWLAQVHFSNNNFTRALALLSRKDLTERSLSCQYLAAHCYIKQGIYDQALSLLGEDNPKHLIDDRAHNARRKLAHLNGNAARHITHRNGRLGPRDRIEYSEERERDREQEKDIQFQAAMCYLRGLCFAKRNAFERARDCYKDAVLIDIQCFEAFDQLMRNSLMSPAEELEFLDKLDFESIRTDDPSLTQEAAQLTKMLYMTRLSKYASPAALTEATETLSTHYNLASNPDLLLTRAATLYTQCRFHEALAITSSILNPQNTNTTDVSSSAAATASSLGHDPTLYPIHLACLYETSSHNTLFLLSHTLSQHAPNEPYTYLAIATYYLSTSRIAEARRFFSKASLMDPHSAPAWIGFAHTFAAEGEHDQAIAAYSTAARLFQGSHLPQLFLGMQHLALNNMQLAWEYCNAAYEMSSGSIRKVEDGNILAFDLNNDLARGDPLVLNELGVIFYHQADLPTAAKLFRQSIIIAEELDCVKTAWVATRANLAHALRRMGNLDESLMEFDECLRITTGGAAPGSSFEPGRGMGHGVGVEEGSGAGGSVSGYDERNLIGSIHTSRALVLMTMQRTQEAVISLHEAVRVLGGDASGGSVAGTLLGRAMELWALEDQDESGMVLGEIPEEQMNAHASVRRAGSKGKGAEDVNIQMREQMRVPRTRGKEVEDGLDQDADDMLNAALGTRS